MLKLLDRIFRSPYYLRELLFIGKYATLLQLMAGLLFCGFSRTGGPLGSLECALLLREAGLTTLTITLLVAMIHWFYRETKTDI